MTSSGDEEHIGGRGEGAVKLSCHEMMLGERSLAEKFSLARESGFDGLDLRGDLLQDQVAEAARLVRETGLPVPAVYGRLQPPLVARTLAERAESLAVIRHRMRDAERVGAQQIIVVPIFGVAQITVQRGQGVEEIEEALLLTLLDELADEARQRRVTIVLEPLNRTQTHLLTSPRKTAQLTRQFGDAVGTMVDTYHMDVEGQDSAAEIEGAFDQLRLVHLSDRDRKLPGTGGLDFAPGLRKLQSCGYAGWYGFECTGPFTVQQLRESVGYVRGCLDRAP
jgi:sugar phosphate isomerase/epimerase